MTMGLPRKPILCVDFDGVIHSYTSGWRGADVIPDPPVSGAIGALLGYLDHFTVCVHSSRFNAFEGNDRRKAILAVRLWLGENGVPWESINWGADINPDDMTGPFGLDPGCINLCATKPSALLTIDDRGWTFDGTFPTAEQIRGFRTWQRRDA